MGKIWTDFAKILYAIGQVFTDVNGQMLKNNLAIWSHWPQAKIYNLKEYVICRLEGRWKLIEATRGCSEAVILL